jgi:hypothetical protein
MMSYRLLKVLAISSAGITSLACTSTTLLPNSSPTSITTPIKISEWETQLPGSQGAVKITFILPQQARAEFQLFDGNSKHVSYAKVRITFSDENCTSGHLTAINYKKTTFDSYIKYFEKEAPWSQVNTVTLAWNIDNQITAILNDETISTEVSGNVDTLKIVSYLAPIDIQKIEYLSQ